MCIYSGGGLVYVHFARAWISYPKIFGTFGWISLKLITTEVKAKKIIKGIMGQCIYVHGFGNFTGDFP